MIYPKEVVAKAWDYMTDGTQDKWNRIPWERDIFAAHEFIKNTLKPALIRTYKDLSAHKERQKSLGGDVTETEHHQANVLEIIGFVEVYLTDFRF